MPSLYGYIISPIDNKKEDSNEKKETNKEQQTQLKAEVLVFASSAWCESYWCLKQGTVSIDK